MTLFKNHFELNYSVNILLLESQKFKELEKVGLWLKGSGEEKPQEMTTEKNDRVQFLLDTNQKGRC